jgi:exodeoxyribonuclease-3
VLERHDPDVVCLQELKCIDEKFPKAELEEKGYFISHFGQKTYNGVAVISKNKIDKETKSFQDKVDDLQSRFLCVETKGIQIASVYVPNGKEVGNPSYDYKLQWLKRLREFLNNKADQKKPIALLGDFNVAPEDKDVYSPKEWEGKILCSEPERKAFREVCDFGLQDVFRKLHPEEGHYSWWDYRNLSFPFNKGLRIDFVLASHSLAEKCSHAEIDREERKGEKPSDHAPVIADFLI